MRFWYCLIYLAVALATVIALNVYLAAIKNQWTLAKIFAGTVVFPSLSISVFFLSNYASQVAGFYLLQMAMLFSALVVGLSVSVFLSPRIIKKYGRRR